MSKNNNTLTDNGEENDITMLMYNLLDYSDNNSMTSGKLWDYCRDEVSYNNTTKNNLANYKINRNKTTGSMSFE